MENASKALLIAGGVLLALMVISLGMYIMGKMQTTALSANERRIQIIKQEQINKFAQYSGEVYGIEVENCIRRMAAFNKNKASDEKIKVSVKKNKETKYTDYTGQASDIINPSASSENKTKINMSATDRNDKYTGSITYKENGMIETISFDFDEEN